MNTDVRPQENVAASVAKKLEAGTFAQRHEAYRSQPAQLPAPTPPRSSV